MGDISANDASDCCSKLAYSTQLSKIISHSIDPPEQINYIYLSYDELVSKLHEKHNKIKQLTLKQFNHNRKIKNMSQNIELNERIFHCIQKNDIKNLNIITTCLNNNRSMGYVLQKLNEAINKKYNPQHSEDDKDLSVIILKFGGPALLEILHRAKQFPSVSTAFRLLNKKKISIESHTSFLAEVLLKKSLENLVDDSHGFIQCIMDSTYMEMPELDGIQKIIYCMVIVGNIPQIPTLLLITWKLLMS